MMTIVYGFGIGWLLVVGVILVVWAIGKLRFRLLCRELIREAERV